MEPGPTYDIIIIGGGAAGFFAAAHIVQQPGERSVLILEGSDKVLQKVKVSGGGRCNVTNAVFRREELPAYYPRGWKLMRKLLSRYGHLDTIEWFESRGVPLYAQPDNRMFPQTNKSQSIVDCLVRHTLECGMEIAMSSRVEGFQHTDGRWTLSTRSGDRYTCHRMLFATGSSKAVYEMLERSGIGIVPPVPSLFTFNIADELLSELAGISVEKAIVKIAGTKFQSEGPLLITHWGLSGPCILKLSSWAARELHQKAYSFTISVNWTGRPYQQAVDDLADFRKASGKKKLLNAVPFGIPKRLWNRILASAGIDPERTWPELGRKQWNLLLERLANTVFNATGKSTFKEEFVTCGGVSLKEVEPATMEHRTLKGLFFAGEVLDIDAVTGGYNFQAAWSTAYMAACGLTAGE